MCRTESDRVGWRCKPLGLGKRVRRVFFHNIRSGDSPYYAVGDALWELVKELQAGQTSCYLLKPNGHGLTGILPAPELPCSPAASHRRLRFRPVRVTTAHVQSILSSPLSVGKGGVVCRQKLFFGGTQHPLVGMKLQFTPWTVLVVGNNLCQPGISKTTKTSSIRHFFGLGGWVGRWVSTNPIIVRISRNVR